jgi:serine/tyrosine/threonine adenylyltransferase
MNALGIPTSRSLAILTTGEDIFRQDVEVGSILVRMMPSHLRGGTFEFARVYGSKDDFEALLNYTLLRHFPESKNTLNPAKDFLEQVIDRQTSLVAEWMRVGFIHGVMNTDNTSIC